MFDLRKNLIERRMIELDVDMAKYFLKFNTYATQRMIRFAHVTELANKIENGLFRFGEIAFASKGREKDILINGQHVCFAVVESGITVPCIIERFKIDNDYQLSEAFRQFEILPRGIRDMIAVEAHALGLKWPIRVSALIVTAAVFFKASGQKKLGGLSSPATIGIKTYLSKGDKVELLRKYLEEGSFVADILMPDGKKSNPKITQHLRRGAVIYIMMKTWQKSPSDAKIFWSRVRDGERLEKTMPEMKIREFLLLTRLTVRTSAYIARSVSSHEYAFRCALAWNSFRKGTNTNLAYHPTRFVPKII